MYENHEAVMVAIIKKKKNTFFILWSILYNWFINFTVPSGKIVPKNASCDTVIMIVWKVIDMVKQNKKNKQDTCVQNF